MTKEHWYQIAAITATIVLMSVGGAAYVVQNIAAVQVGFQREFTAMQSRLATDEERITALERLEADHHNTDVAFQSEMRNGIAALIQANADIRVSIAHALGTRK